MLHVMARDVDVPLVLINIVLQYVTIFDFYELKMFSVFTFGTVPRNAFIEDSLTASVRMQQLDAEWGAHLYLDLRFFDAHTAKFILNKQFRRRLEYQEWLQSALNELRAR